MTTDGTNGGTPAKIGFAAAIRRTLAAMPLGYALVREIPGVVEIKGDVFIRFPLNDG